MKKIKKIIPTKHFVKRLDERMFDLSVLLELIDKSQKCNCNKKIEVSSGNATIVAEIKQNGVIKLITGWVGKRRKK